MDVFLLWHIYELTDCDGIRDEEKAADAIEQLKGKEGFRDYPVSCFEIHKDKIDRVSWADGFSTVHWTE